MSATALQAAQSSVQAAKAEKGRLRALIDSKVNQYAKDPISQMIAQQAIKSLEAQIDAIDKKINEGEALIKKYTGLSDIISPVKKVMAKDYAGAGVDILSQYATKYGNMQRTLFNVSSPRVPVFTAGIVTVAASYSAELSAKLTTKAENNATTIVSKGEVNGRASAQLDVTLGLSTPVGNVGITGGVRGNIGLLGSVTATLSGKGTAIDGTLTGKIDFNMSAELFLNVPSILTKLPLGIKSSYTYPLGQIMVITATLPTYSVNFDMKTGKFSGRASGKPQFALHSSLKAKIDQFKTQILGFLKRFSPANIAKSAIEKGKKLFKALFG